MSVRDQSEKSRSCGSTAAPQSTDAVEQRLFLSVGCGKACEPFRIGELLRRILGRP